MFSFDNYYKFMFIALNLIFWPSYIYVFTTVVIREIERVRINKYLEEWKRQENNECDEDIGESIDEEEETEESMQQLQSDNLNLLDQENRLSQEQVNQERLDNKNSLNEQARSNMDKSSMET
ncbi:MAG: hypothetical protein PUE27_10790 [Sharpea porci]|uniref:hypothetical protein n=1 Tax=Sharpea porci TaxID=2652286 RepID=UPI00240A716C|nr:hypothetical protein [Sharpea porci]MDD6712550.1 hypothetical protein [Sharpea porci]